jgi:hypothetical protein
MEALKNRFLLFYFQVVLHLIFRQKNLFKRNQLKQEFIEIKDEKKEIHEFNFFKPCYNASFIGFILIKDKYSEKDKLNVLKKYEPFLKY